ncbi:MAG: sodium/solute symporter [Pirellulales bacterium]
MTGSLGIGGYLVLVVYMVATVWLGLSFARKQKNLAEYFLAERAAPWWAVGISVLACDLSAISYMGSPAYTFYNDLRLPMSSFLVPLVAWIVAFLFIPFLARLQVYTIYEYLEHRFSLSARLFASAVFSIQRALHIAIAIFAVSLALQQIVNWPVWFCATLIGVITTLYTVFGGMKAVLWTDVMQFFVLMGGIFVMLGAVLWAFQGDVAHIWNVAAAAGRTKMFTFDSNFLDPKFWMEMTVWGLIWGTLATNVAAYGSDQVLVQRYIAAGSGKLMTRSLMFSAALTIPVMMLLYFLGLGFFAYYHAPENTALLASLNELVAKTDNNENMVMPHFIVNVLPSGLGGLVFAGLFAATMSVFSSGLNSLSTVTCVDFIQRLSRFQGKPSNLTLENARWVTLVWGVVVTLAAVGVYFTGMKSIVEAAFMVIGFFSGPLLGMFLLGMFSMRANSLGAILGALCGFAVALLLRNHVSFIWFAVTGCVPTLFFGYLLSHLAPSEPREHVYPMTIWGRDMKIERQHPPA